MSLMGALRWARAWYLTRYLTPDLGGPPQAPEVRQIAEEIVHFALKECPMCCEPVRKAARRCKWCTSAC